MIFRFYIIIKSINCVGLELFFGVFEILILKWEFSEFEGNKGFSSYNVNKY